MEFSLSEWRSLFNYAKKRGLYFMVSVFSEEAFRMISKLDVCAWKVSSGEINNFNLLELMIKTKKTIIVSTGMSNNAEIKKIISFLKKKELILLFCNVPLCIPPQVCGYECGRGN